MSKSPIKQMDQGLVSAYRRAKMAGVGEITAKSEGMGSIADTATDFMKDIKKHKANEEIRIADSKKEGEELATNILDTDGGLTNNHYDAYGTMVEGLQSKYDEAVVGGDKAEAAKLLGNLNAMKIMSEQTIALRKEIAATFDIKTVDGKETPNLITNLNIDDQNMLKSMMDPKTEVRVRQDGDEFITEMNYNGKWINKNDLERKLYECQQDVVSINDIQKLRDKVKSNSIIDSSVNNVISSWDEDETARHISKILSTGNMVSLANDDILGDGKSFKQNLLESPVLAKIDYVSLGLDPNTVIEVKDTEGRSSSVMLDANNDGKLSPDEVKYLTDADKAKIVEAFTDPKNKFYKEDKTREIMTGYLTQHMKTNYEQHQKDFEALKKEQTKQSIETKVPKEFFADGTAV